MMQPTTTPDANSRRDLDWKALVTRFEVPDRRRASWQLVNSVGAYVATFAAMLMCLSVAPWLVAPLLLVAGGLLVRVFIICHDCGHGSFFKSKRANGFWGQVCGTLTWTAFAEWRHEHNMHHGSTGNLDRRGVGDIWTMTVNEYLAASRSKRTAYRISRHPAVILGIAPLWMFVVENRFPRRGSRGPARAAVWWTNLYLAVLMSLGLWLFGPAFILLQLAVMMIAGTVGVWLFYVQHQFEDAYWKSAGDWNYVEAAIRGSTFLKLPRWLQWFTGNIGYHHVHHLSARIPNYALQRCHESHPLFREAPTLTILGSLKTFGLTLFDETSAKLIGFGDLARQRRAGTVPVAARGDGVAAGRVTAR